MQKGESGHIIVIQDHMLVSDSGLWLSLHFMGSGVHWCLVDFIWAWQALGALRAMNGKREDIMTHIKTWFCF
jgi:hypothetical protein